VAELDHPSAYAQASGFDTVTHYFKKEGNVEVAFVDIRAMPDICWSGTNQWRH